MRTLYVDYLGRRPEPRGLNHWRYSLRTGMTPGEVAQSVLGSVEYFRKAGAAWA